MGSITEGVVAGLQIRQRRDEFAANQQDQELDRQRQIDQFSQQMAMKQREIDAEQSNRGVRIFEQFNVMRDRIAAEAPQYRKDLSEWEGKVNALSMQRDALAPFTPPEAMQGILGSLKSAVETRDALRDLAVEREQRLSSLDRALTNLSMTMRGSPAGQAVGEAAGSSGQPTTESAPTDAETPAENAAEPGEEVAQMGPAVDPLELIQGFFEQRGFTGAQKQGRGLVFTASQPGEAKAIQEQVDNLGKLMFGGQAPPVRVIDRWPELEKAPERFAAAQRLENAAVGDLQQIDSIMLAPDKDEMLRAALNSRPVEDQSETAKSLRMALNAKGAQRDTILKAAKEAASAAKDEAKAYTEQRKKMLGEYDSIINGAAYNALGTPAPNQPAAAKAAGPPAGLDRNSYAVWYTKNVATPPPASEKEAYAAFLKSFNEAWTNYGGGR